MNWVLNIGNQSTNCLKTKPTFRSWSSGSRLKARADSKTVGPNDGVSAKLNPESYQGAYQKGYSSMPYPKDAILFQYTITPQQS